MQKPPFLFGREEIKSVLLADWQARKRQQWTSVSLRRVVALRKHLEDRLASESAQLFDEDNLLVLGRRSHVTLNSPSKALAKLHKTFPLVQVLLEKFRDHLVLAGGSLSSAMIRGRGNNQARSEDDEVQEDKVDADFFFVNVSIERAGQMLEEIAAIFDSKSLSVEGRPSEKARRVENECVTTFVHQYHVYQFVHRIYPSAMHVIGGFDLGPSMIYYDGKTMRTSAFGAFCIANLVIIGDVSRRSTSYESRIAKYVRTKSVRLLLCNTTAEKIVQFVVKQFEGFTCMGVVHFMLAQSLEVKIDVRKARLAMESHDNSDVIDVVGPREASSDYVLFPELDWRDLGTFNIRAIARGRLNQVMWEHDENGDRVFPPTQLPDFPLVRRTGTCSSSFVRYWWPLRDITRFDRIPGYNERRIPPSLIDEMMSELEGHFNILHATKDGRRIKWITENPGRQWTAAFNPITTADSWYHKDLRNPLKIGIQDDVYCLLRCAHRKGYGPFASCGHFPLDCFKMILDTVCWVMALDAERLCLGARAKRRVAQ
jgi:hypothetical protein